MLDIQFIRTNPQIVAQACRDKQLDDTLVNQLLEVDARRRELIGQVETFRKASNQHAEAIKQQVQTGQKPTPEQIEAGKRLKQQLKELEPDLKSAEEEFLSLQYQIPNIPAADVPVGKDEAGNIVVRTEGTLPQFEFTPLPHQELMENLDLLDTKRAVTIGGFRAYFLKNAAVLLEQAVLNYALTKLTQAGFTPMTTPVLVNEPAMWGTGYFPWGKEDHYRTQDQHILAGTSEVALTAYYQDEILTEKDLPIRMVGISPCFRREIGSYGKDTKGIVRVHQFNKIEQVVYTVADEEITREWHEKMLGFSESLLQDLELPYQVLQMCTGDMGAGQRKKYDLETWFPSQNTYRETHSASYFNDFQARRLNIRYRAKDGSLKFVYTLNNTMAATPRLIAAIIENYQTADASIRVPKVLQSFVGMDLITR